MFRKPVTSSNTRKLDHLIREGINTNFKPTYGPVNALLQEARAQLLVALSRYQRVEHEDGDNSTYIYPTYINGRITRISEIAGCFQSDAKFVGLWHLLPTPNADNLSEIIFQLSDVLQPMEGFPPLQKALQMRVQNAIMLVIEAMRKGNYFPAPTLDWSVRVLVAVAKAIDKEKLPHLLCQYPDLMKEIHNHNKIKEAPQSDNKQLLEAVELVYSQLFPIPVTYGFGELLSWGASFFTSESANSVTTDTVSWKQSLK